MTLTQLAERVGITLANLSILKTNKGRAIRFTTLEALCRELDCQPGDLLEFVAENHDSEEVQSTRPTEHRSELGLPGDYY